ncbi:hypothetical protein O181_029585 [Austropuccinia psidii MF-1]|uniref:Uncharacterized protein n=1 Tax=Austropuccinia psidii MF-1 TaxID=1389203 RepID=A0A9Q3CUP8_9BASI|nr:hypothetical protein [Austropuccinia psidii MF-1]
MLVCCPTLPTTWPEEFTPRHPHEDSFVVHNDESIPEWEWKPGPQTDRREQFQMISPVPSSIHLSTPLLGHHPMVTSLLDQMEVIIRPMKEGNGKRTFELGPIVTHAIQMPKTHLILALIHPPNHMRMFQLKRLTLRWLRRNPWRTLLVSPKFSSPFLRPSPARPAPPPSVIIIDNTPIRSPLHPVLPRFLPWRALPFPPRAQRQAPLLPTMRLARNSLTCDQH